MFARMTVKARAAALTALCVIASAAPSASAQGFGYPNTDRWQSDRWDAPRRAPVQESERYDDRYEEPDEPRYQSRAVPRPNERVYQDRRYGDDNEAAERDNAERQYRNRSGAYGSPRRVPRDDDQYEEDAGRYRRDTAREPQSYEEQAKVQGADGGGRPDIPPQAPPHVAFAAGYAPGSIVIDTSARRLYYVTGPMSALAYPIGVGREGFSWTGQEKISRIADWPDWYPPAEMRNRKPELPERMLGGIRNPLGVKALYLGNTLYRIHGTNDPKSIGKAESSGCFRMLNAHVLHLATLAGVGTQVTIVNSLRAPKVIAAKPAPKPRPIVERVPPRPRVASERVPSRRFRDPGEYYPWDYQR